MTLEDMTSSKNVTPSPVKMSKVKKMKVNKAQGFTRVSVSKNNKAQDFLSKNRIMDYDALRPIMRS